MTITLQVTTHDPIAPICDIQASGIAPTSALTPPPSPGSVINLVILKRDASYQMLLYHGVCTRATLNLSEMQISDLIGQARAVLEEIVDTTVNGEYVYHSSYTTIPIDIHTASLQKLAEVGALLYHQLFYGSGSSTDARAISKMLAEISQPSAHSTAAPHIQIIAERFVFPWALLYDRDPYEPIVQEGFWGFKYVIEHLPESSNPNPTQFTSIISADHELDLAMVVNTHIDDQLREQGLPLAVQAQRELLHSLHNLRVFEHTARKDLYELLKNADTPAQLLYFYCHAGSTAPGQAGGITTSTIQLSDGWIQLSDLILRAPTHQPPLKQAPLVFFNACQSAELSPWLYDGLVPYLVARGARGVLGTESKIPALFAAEFAQVLLTRFLGGGVPIGELLLELRREYLARNNLLGLLYALYSSGDVMISKSHALDRVSF